MTTRATPAAAAAGMLKRYSSPKRALEMAQIHSHDYREGDERHTYWIDVARYIMLQANIGPDGNARENPLKHVSSNFYKISDAQAGRLAKASGAKLPKPGYQLTVLVNEELLYGHSGGLPAVMGWIQRTPYSPQAHPDALKRGWIWAVTNLNSADWREFDALMKSGAARSNPMQPNGLMLVGALAAITAGAFLIGKAVQAATQPPTTAPLFQQGGPDVYDV